MPKLIDFNKFGLKSKGIVSACYFETKNSKWGFGGKGGGVVYPPFGTSTTIYPISLKFGMHILYVQVFDFMVGLLPQNESWVGWGGGGVNGGTPHSVSS